MSDFLAWGVRRPNPGETVKEGESEGREYGHKGNAQILSACVFGRLPNTWCDRSITVLLKKIDLS